MLDQSAGTLPSVAKILDLPALPASKAKPSVAEALDLPVAPEPVKHRAFDDAPAAREAMQGNILKAVQGRYPIENQRHRLALENIGWKGAEHFNLSEQKRAIMRGDSLDRQLEGDWVLYDKETGTELERRRLSVAHVPYLTNRGTFIYRGNEYTVGNQMRLKPGVYTRVKENGILEAHVNVRPGTGSSFRIYMEPETGIFRMGLGQSELKLYPILKAMGVGDEQLEKYWGRDLLMRNVEAEDPRAVSRAFHKLVGQLEEEPPEDEEVDGEESEKEAADHLRSDHDAEVQSKRGEYEGSADDFENSGDRALGHGAETNHEGQDSNSADGRGHSARPASGTGSDADGVCGIKEAAGGADQDSFRLAHEEGLSGRNGTSVRAGCSQSADLSADDGFAAFDIHDAGSDQGSAERGRQVKQAATEAGVRAASKWIAPVLGAAAIPAGVQAGLYGYGLAGVAREVRPEIRKTKEMVREFRDRFGSDAIKDYSEFDPKGDTYKQWRKLRQLKFLEPYISVGHRGLNAPVTGNTEAIDVVRKLRQLTGTWKNYQSRHYGAFLESPREALKVLTTEGIEDTKAKGLGAASRELMSDYDRLSEKYGPYEGLRRLYNEPWAKLNLSSPEAIKRYTDEFGNDQLDNARKKQALLFYASKSKLYAPKWYNALTTGSSLGGHALGLGGAALTSVGGYHLLSGLARLLKRGEVAAEPEDIEQVEKAREAQPIADILGGANPLSTRVDVMGIGFKPESRKEELKRVVPAVLGKGLVGAIVVPSMARAGVELVRGLSRQGPYAQIPSRLRAGASGLLLGSVIPAATLLRALNTGRVLKAIERGRLVDANRLKLLAKQLGEAPLRSSKATVQAIRSLEAGRAITPEIAREARREMFEPNTTILLNALLGGGLTGYAGYAAYKRGRQLREAFEQTYGKELPPEVAAVIMNPAKVRELSKMRRETLTAERRANRMDELMRRRQVRHKSKRERKSD